MIPAEDNCPSDRRETGATTVSGFIGDAPVLLKQLYQKHAYEHYQQLKAEENMSLECEKALMLAVYKGSDLFYNERPVSDKGTNKGRSKFLS